MYFAIDHHDSAYITAGLREAFNAHRASTPSGPYLLALMDSAFDHGLKKLKWATQSSVLYGGHSTLTGLGAVSPRLLALSQPNSPAFATEISKLSYHCNGRPMLSFLQSKVDAATLIAQWRKCLMLTTPEDKEPYLVRLADTRITPSLATMPQPTLWAALSGSIEQWLIIGRQGALEKLKLIAAPSNPLDGPENDDIAIEITDADISHLLACGQPDSVINAMEDNFAEVLPSHNRSKFYQQVAQICQTAQHYRIEAFPDVLALAMANHLVGGELIQNKNLLARLKVHDWVDGALSNLLGDYMPESVQ